jgi:hypothetical protein
VAERIEFLNFARITEENEEENWRAVWDEFRNWVRSIA